MNGNNNFNKFNLSFFAVYYDFNNAHKPTRSRKLK
jgi:hypothetical protein